MEKKIFLSYAHEQAGIAREIAFQLSAENHQVFLDHEALQPGMSFTEPIATEIENCDLFLFLISPESIAEGHYTRTELAIMRKKNQNPSGKVLPVMVKHVLFQDIDPYLRAVTILVPEGNAAAEVVIATREIFGGPAVARNILLDAPVQAGRLEAYKKLWSLTALLPKWPRAENIGYEDLHSLSEHLRNWYFEGNGMFLSRNSFNVYATLQAGLTTIVDDCPSGRISGEHYDAVRELCSALRGQLAADLGTRTK